VKAYKSLGALDVLVSEKELPIEVAKVYCIKVYDVDFAEACEDEVLEEFAAYASSADH
jgi:hypothetical protein